MASYLDASMLNADNMHVSSPHDYPTPGSYAESSQSVEPEQQPKKKRKAWGQPVPEINPILPPRKRAKTAEEKEQRKNERILRNRRAADKSRQRQKAEVEALRDRQLETEAENAKLKDILARYQSQFGQLPGCEFNPQISPSQLTSLTPRPSISVLTPQSMDDQSHQSEFGQCDETPTFSAATPTTPFFKDSPVLAPDLNLGHGAMYPSLINATGMTQYPAEVLCDLQCQPVMSMARLRSLQPNNQLFEVLTSIHCLLMLQTFSAKTLLSQAFRLLMEILSTNSSQLESLIQTNFHLIHILITMPSTEKQTAVFRLKLLSRLLACNPNLALLLEKAADRTLQQLYSSEYWTEDANSRWAWSTIMTIKWSVKWLEGEHDKIRAEIKSGVLDQTKWNSKGVDYGAVEYTMGLWDEMSRDRSNCITTTMMDTECVPMNSIEVN